MLSVHCLCLLLAMFFTKSLALESFRAEDGYDTIPTVNGSRYKLSTNETTWAEALAACQEDGDGAQLVILNSQEEATAIGKIVSSVTNQYAFAGINDIVVEGTWLTIIGCPVADSGYNRWQATQPDDHNGKEDCGGISVSGLYNDVECNSRRPFICEKPNA